MVKLKSYLRLFTDVIMFWLTVMNNMSHRRRRICSNCHPKNVTYRIRLITGFVLAWARRQVSRLKHDLPTVKERIISHTVFGLVHVPRSLAFYVVFCTVFLFISVMDLTGFFRLMSLNVLLVFFASLLMIYYCKPDSPRLFNSSINHLNPPKSCNAYFLSILMSPCFMCKFLKIILHAMRERTQQHWNIKRTQQNTHFWSE